MRSIKTQKTIFIIYGATGDLCWRKLIPALYNLFLDGWMPDKFLIVGAGRSPLSNEEFPMKMLDGVNLFSRSGKAVDDKWNEFAKHLVYESADLTNYETYHAFCKYIDEKENEWGTKPYVIQYLAVVPSLFPLIASNIAKKKLSDQREHTRIVMEKPLDMTWILPKH